MANIAAPNTHWLNRKRLTVYPRVVLVVMAVVSIVWVLLAKQNVDLKGKPLGYDFITFWAASHLALAGNAAAAYDIARIFPVEQIAFPASNSVFVWYYPPSFFLLVAPLALMPYFTAYWVFILSTLAGYLAVFRRSLDASLRNGKGSGTAMWCLAAFSGLWMNLFHGQNAFLTAAIAAAAILCLKRRPTLAGILIGLLAIKPHLALLFPIALVAIGAWRAIATAAVTGTAFMAIGTAVLGTATLRACLASLSYARRFLETGALPWPKMPTVFAFLRLLGAPVALAYTVHGVVALAATFAVWQVWRSSLNWRLRGASLMTATFLISPYVFDYDLAWLAFPIAWLVIDGLQSGWFPGEREVLVAAWALPMVMAPFAEATHVQTGPFVLSALLLVVLRRTRRIPPKTDTATLLVVHEPEAQRALCRLRLACLEHRLDAAQRLPRPLLILDE